MDYARPALADRLAGAYVLGTLRGAARRRFEALLPAHPQLRDATRGWQERLMPMTAAIEPVVPPPTLWPRIETKIGGSAAAAAAVEPASGLAAAGGRPVAAGLGFWRGLAGLATAAAVGLALVVAMPRETPPPVVVVLAATTPAPGETTPRPMIVASISGDRSTLVTRAIVPVDVRPDRSLELWAVPKQGPARSLGLLSSGTDIKALSREVLVDTDTLAVTVEPPGGSPTGKATGPIVYAGKFTL